MSFASSAGVPVTRIEALLEQPGAHFRVAQDRDEFAVEQRHHLARQARRPEQRVPDVDVDVLHAGFGERRHIGRHRRALRAAGGEHVELARLHLRQRDVHRQEHELDLAAEQVGHRARGSLVRHVHHLQAEVQLEQFHRQVVRRRVAGRGVVELAGLAFTSATSSATLRAGTDGMRDQRQVADRREADRRHHLRVVGHGLVQHRALHQRGGGHQQRVAVGRRLGDRLGADVAARAGPVLDRPPGSSVAPGVSGAKTRARMSMPVPGVNGTISLMGRLGYWACARAAQNAHRSNANRLSARILHESTIYTERMTVSLDDIRAAAQRIAGAVERTPCLHSRTLSRLTGAEVWLKFENLQFTASFKERGALNKLLSLATPRRAARRDRDERRQPRAGRRLPRGAPGHARGDRDAARHAEHQGAQHAGAGRRSGARRRHARRGRAPRARARGARRPHLHPSLRRPGDHRRPGHGRAGNARAGAGAGHAGGADRRRRADRRHGDRGEGAQARRSRCSAWSRRPTARCTSGCNGLPVDVGGDTIAEGLAVRDVGELPLSILSKLWQWKFCWWKKKPSSAPSSALIEIEKTVAEGAGAAGLAALLAAPGALRRPARRHPGLRRQHRLAHARRRC